MNIFATSSSPVACAQALDDSRVIKMILESAQLLSTAVRQVNPSVGEALGLYKSTHQNHPCAKWTRANQANFAWLLAHARALCDEYTWRFGKLHKSRAVIERAAEAMTMFPWGAAPTPWPNVTTFPDLPLHDAYRKALCAKWAGGARPPKWTCRGAPEWAMAFGQPSVHLPPVNVAPSLTHTTSA